MSCINTNLPYFKELQTKLNVAAPVLKLILHKLQRDRGNLDISPEEIDLWLQGDSVEFGENSLKLYEQSYKEPIIVNEEEYANALALAKAAFPAEAVRSYQGVDGRYVIRVAEPTNGILKNAKRDSEGRLLANNGKVSNLTELQYVQVRTPQFKRWFGDWLRSPETASKVVDENGEPLVVYHGGEDNINVFQTYHKDADVGDMYGAYFTKDEKYAKTYEKGKIYPVFLNIKNPLVTEGSWTGVINDASVFEQYDGIINDKFDNGILQKLHLQKSRSEIIIRKPDQVKSATSNTGEFSTLNNNIYLNKTGDILKIIQNIPWIELVRREDTTHKTLYKEHGKMYITLGEYYRNEADLEKVVNSIKNHLIRNGINPNSLKFNISKKSNRIEVTPNDAIQKSETRLISTKSIETTLAFLETKIPGLSHRVIREQQLQKMGILSNAKAFFKDGVVYLVEGRFNEDIAIEECLHPLVNAIKAQNPELFSQLYDTATELFPALHEEIKNSYDANSVEQELVTLALSRNVREELKNNKDRSKWKNLVNKFYNFVKNLFGEIQIGNIKPTTTFKELAQIINSENGVFNVDITGLEYHLESQAEQENQSQETSQQQDKMLEQIYIINEQFNRILESKTLTSTDLAEVSDIIADMISSKIDEMEAKRDQVKEILVRRNPNDNTDVEKLSRFDLINSLGVQYFIDLVKQDFAKNRRTAIPKNRAKINEVIKNWDYFINRIKSNISEAEGIHLEVSATGEKSAKADDTLVDQYDEEGNNIQDQVEDGQLSWQIENNTIDPVTSITQLVRLRLRGLYELRDNGRRSEDGSILYDHIKTKWGTDAKVGSTRAAKCLLRWLNDKPSVKEMVKVLESKSRKNPWVTPLISMLSDKSGDNVTEQSQFFCSFYKPFMKFTNVGTKDGMLVSRPLNEHPFLTLTIKTIEASYKLGQHPLIVKGLKAGAKALNNHYVTLQELTKNFEANKEVIFEELRAVTKGLGFEINVAELHLEEEEVTELMHQLNIINMVLERNADKADYDPFAFGKNAEGVRSNFMRFFEKLTDQYEDEAVTSFYEGGKMRQSYLLPSFLTMFSNKFKLEDAAFNRFLVDEFNSEFMRNNLIEEGLSDADLEVAVKKGWNNVWLQHMVLDPKKRRNFGCKTSITFNGHTYMRGMSPEEYALSMITEFFGENSKETDSLFLANFRVPIEANKPSAEYITFYARGGVSYKEDLVGDFLNVFNQELCRIKTVILREKARTEKLAKLKELHDNERITTQQYNSLVYSVNQEAISRFDERGKTFVYLDFLNKEVQNGTKLGKLIEKVKNGEKVDQAELSKEASIAIEAAIKERVNNMIEKFKKNGVFESCKTIEKIGTSDKAVQEKLELMLWNDAFASTQIMQLLITDPAFLKDTDDVQKRFAQVHASGTRANISATYKGIEVSDGVHRSITLKDVTELVSNIIDNLTEVLDRKIEAARKANNRSEIIAWEAFKDKLVGDNGLYRKGINLTDAQAYSCPSSYRKKAIMFGEWSDEKEATYNRIKDGNYTYSDVASVFQPFKPFVYGNSIESTGVNAEGAMTKMRVPVQNKNAECLLVMADAILAGEETGRPNLLRALFEVMEESHYDTVRGEDGSITRTYKTNGIDTVNFESAVKSGAQGRIDTQAYAGGKETLIETSKGETKTLSLSHENAFKGQLRSLIYNTETVNGEEVTSYNRNTVKHLSFEYYCMQQSVPEHFLDHAQLEGSQQRALTPSDLATTTIDENGQIQTVYYEVGENKVKITAEQLRERYDQVHADIIQKGIDEINGLFKLKDSSPQERKEALSELLIEQFLKDGRYSGDMLYMVTLNRETGDFPVSLEDSSIRTQVEQAINSIIKSRVNKIKMPGGPLVQMSNFGMSKELKIRFLDKDGNPLKDRSAFESDEAYKEYVSKNQKGIAHWEVIAPAYTETIFREFMDKEGNISVEALEMLSPELLKMIGYRIPTEAKYSIAPLKIVGFAPREMGDVIILPAEITLVNGSDFDVDKEYCIRKALEIIHKIGLSAEEKNLSKEEQTIIRANKAAARLANELSNLNREVKGISKYSTIRAFAERFVNDPFNKKLWMSAGFTEAQYKDILKRYVNIMYSVVPTKEVGTLKNEIFDMSYAVLTSEHTVAKALKPGGFEEHKLYGYAVAAYRLPEVRAKYPNFDSLLKMDTEKLGKLIEESGKNLIFLDTQLEYYDHNNSASSLLGISAVNSGAHAILVDDNIGVNLINISIPVIDGFKFIGNDRTTAYNIKLDPSVAADGASIAETLGSCVGASADAAKDPVMNLLNLTPQTFNVYTTLIRLGVPNPTACLLMSSKVLSDAIKAANAKVLTGEWASPESILREKISIDELKKLGYSLDSPIFNEELTRDELIKGIHSDDINITLKISNALISLFTASKRIRLADQITRLNSTSSAVGPTTLDNYVFQSNLEALDSESYLVDLNTGEPIGSREILEKHKMLAKFYQAYDLANSILINGMPQTRAFLESIEGICTQPTVEGLDIKYGLPSIVKNDRALMGKLREFFTSWTAVKKGLVNYNELKFLSKELPLTLTAKKKEHADNYLVQNLYLDIDKRSGFPIISMNISKIEKESKNKLAASWAELYTKDKEFAINIFKYSFFRGGLGFSPKTFMNVLPIQMKLKMEKYLDVYRHAEVLSDNEVSLFYKQFISNNYLDNKLVPIKKAKPGSDGKIAIAKESKNAYLFKNVRFFKIKDGSSYKLYEFVEGEEEGPIYRVYKEIPILGANGNFIELSTHNIDKSLFDLQFDLEDDGSMKSTPNVDDMFDDKLITVVEANKFLNNITSESQTLTKDEPTVNKEAKDILVLKASTRLLSMLKDKGYTSVELSDIDKMLDDLNLC